MRCSCIDTISRTATLSHRHVMGMKGLSTCEVTQVSQHTTKSLQMLTIFVHLEANLTPS